MTKSITPPNSVNYSPESLARASELLDAETAEILKRDRARLVQQSISGILDISGNLGIDDASRDELCEAFRRRVAELSPTYHDYVNQLIGAVALVLQNQPGQTSSCVASDEADQTVPESIITTDPEHADEAFEDASEDCVGTSTTMDSTKVVLDPLPNDKVSASPVMTREVKPIKDRAFQSMCYIFGDKAIMLDDITYDQFVKLAGMIVDIYETSPIKHSSAAKKPDIVDRARLFFGVNGEMMNYSQIARLQGYTDMAIRFSMDRFIKSTSLLIAGRHQELIDIATGVQEPTFLEPADLNDSVDTASDTVDTVEMPEEVSTALVMQEIEPKRLFYDHYRGLPFTMKEFVRELTGGNKELDFTQLTNPQASLLCERIVQAYGAKLRLNKKSEEAIRLRTSLLERYIGLYEQPLGVSELAVRRATSTTQIRNTLTSAVDFIKKHVSKDEIGLIAQAIQDTDSKALQKRVNRV